MNFDQYIGRAIAGHDADGAELWRLKIIAIKKANKLFKPGSLVVYFENGENAVLHESDLRGWFGRHHETL